MKRLIKEIEWTPKMIKDAEESCRLTDKLNELARKKIKDGGKFYPATWYRLYYKYELLHAQLTYAFHVQIEKKKIKRPNWSTGTLADLETKRIYWEGTKTNKGESR